MIFLVVIDCYWYDYIVYLFILYLYLRSFNFSNVRCSIVALSTPWQRKPSAEEAQAKDNSIAKSLKVLAIHNIQTLKPNSDSGIGNTIDNTHIQLP